MRASRSWRPAARSSRRSSRWRAWRWQRAPAAPSAPDLAAASDTGISPTDNITKTLTGLVFTGTADVGLDRRHDLRRRVDTDRYRAFRALSRGVLGHDDNADPRQHGQPDHRQGDATLPGEGLASPALTVTTDNLAPTVTNVTSSTANATYAAGTVIPITVTFNEVVWVTGTP